MYLCKVLRRIHNNHVTQKHRNMKITLLKIVRKKEVMNRLDLLTVVEMIAETFSKPKDGEGRWYGTNEMLSLLAGRYAYFDAKKATPIALGKSINNYKFNFKHHMVNGLSEYWLVEK